MGIFEFSNQQLSQFEGVIELDDSYFGAKRGRGAAGKIPVFGLLKKDANVYVTVVPNCSKESLMPIIQGKILEGSTIHRWLESL